MEEHDAVAVALEGDVAAILGDGGTHPRLQQLLDGLDGLGVLGAEELALARALLGLRAGGNGLARLVVLHDSAENGRLQMLPLSVALGYADEVRAEKHTGDAVNLEQPRRQRRALGLLASAKLQGAIAEHRAARNEFERGRIGCRFGLDEHDSSFRTANAQTPRKARTSAYNCSRTIVGLGGSKVKARYPPQGATEWVGRP